MDSEPKKLVNPSDNELTLHVYNTAEHESDLNDLLKLRELNSYNHYIPEVGFCVYRRKKVPVSYVFIRKIEGNSAMLDSMISNPSISPELRNKANDMLINAALNHLKEQKTDIVLAFTKDINTLMRVRSHGLTLLEGYQVALASYAHKEP